MAKSSKPKGSKWKKMPKGWKSKSRKKFWESLVGDSEHPVKTCIEKMTGKVDDPGAFCAALADRVLKRTTWRGEKKASSQDFVYINHPAKLADVTDQILSRLTTGAGRSSGTVWVMDPDIREGQKGNLFDQYGKSTMEAEIVYGLRAYADEGYDDAAPGSPDRAKYAAMYQLINEMLTVSFKHVVSPKTQRRGWHVSVDPTVRELEALSKAEARTMMANPSQWDPEDFFFIGERRRRRRR